MSVRIFGHVIVPAAYFDRLERVEDELIDSEILRRKQAEDAEEALAVARSVKERWKSRAKELDEKLTAKSGQIVALEEALARAEGEAVKALRVLKEAEDRLEAAEKELREWRSMGTTLQEWSNLLTYDGSVQTVPEKEPSIRMDVREGER